MALTTTSTLTQELFDQIASEMLLAVDDQHVYVKAGPVNSALESPEPGAKTVSFNKPTLDTGTYSETSRRLTEGTAVNSGAKAIAMSTVQATIREYAGPYDNTATAVVPFGLTERLKKLAKHQLAELVGNFLGRDRVKFLNTVYRDLLLSSTNVVCVGGVAEGSITASQIANADWLRRLNEQMKALKVPAFPNGKFRLAITTKQERELKADADVKQAFAYRGDNPFIQGYLGTAEGFDIILDTYMPTKGVGSASGVTGYQAAAWGPLGIGHQVVMAPEPRRADDTDFGRQDRIIWLSYDAIALLYPELIVRGVST